MLLPRKCPRVRRQCQIAVPRLQQGGRILACQISSLQQGRNLPPPSLSPLRYSNASIAQIRSCRHLSGCGERGLRQIIR
ncbi:hypothetical protein CEXT_6981 [Caerostris extrusa]|uniref:Uncharacterized protein n=1 Tax=Caerostris extrusa TaxID=172846 RepID=A0AAV4UM03_CAEEX|nr:hypothetical protein CEXT_6981 [Caerostris extrusa]